jgi:hypothetical protein
MPAVRSPPQTQVCYSFAAGLGQTEVHDLDLPVCVDDQVGRFDVAVDDALLVRRLQPLRGLNRDIERLVEFERPPGDHLSLTLWPSTRAIARNVFPAASSIS